MGVMTKAQIWSAIGKPTQDALKVEYVTTDEHILPRTAEEWLAVVGMVALVLFLVIGLWL